ncbi:hypothetical protein KCP77_06425 [Salmonella enterica subsp. enterica]|nr:hypothetical protein KCP77_06425 [Salmonella enterica subsp. enterica]
MTELLTSRAQTGRPRIRRNCSTRRRHRCPGSRHPAVGRCAVCASPIFRPRLRYLYMCGIIPGIDWLKAAWALAMPGVPKWAGLRAVRAAGWRSRCRTAHWAALHAAAETLLRRRCHSGYDHALMFHVVSGCGIAGNSRSAAGHPGYRLLALALTAAVAPRDTDGGVDLVRGSPPVCWLRTKRAPG